MAFVIRVGVGVLRRGNVGIDLGQRLLLADLLADLKELVVVAERRMSVIRGVLIRPVNRVIELRCLTLVADDVQQHQDLRETLFTARIHRHTRQPAVEGREHVDLSAAPHDGGWSQLRRAEFEGVVELADAVVIHHVLAVRGFGSGRPVRVLDEAHGVDPGLVERSDRGVARPVFVFGIGICAGGRSWSDIELEIGDLVGFVGKARGVQARAMAVRIGDVSHQLQVQHLLVEHRLEMLVGQGCTIHDREHRRHVVGDRPRFEKGRHLQMTAQILQTPLVLRYFRHHASPRSGRSPEPIHSVVSPATRTNASPIYRWFDAAQPTNRC